MRLLLLCALAAALVGCRSSRSDQDGESVRKKRDYYSINRNDRAFLWESMRSSRKLRREELKAALDFAGHYKRSKELRRNSRKFAVETFWLGEWENFRDMLSSVKREIREETDDFGADVRFGFLDSGD